MKRLKGYQPLCLIGEDILLYKNSKLILYYESLDTFKTIINLNPSFIRKLNGRFRLLSRIFRTDIRTALHVGSDDVIFSLNRSLYHVSIKENKVNKFFEIRRGFSDPLNICLPLKETDYIALFGDYGNNPNREEVSIYGISNDFSVEEVYKFAPGKIRHIHNIIRDQIKKGYYIFTGDNEKESGIYWANSDFSIVKPVFLGSQKSRAVGGFATKKGLLYATDSVSEQNYIYLLNENDEGVTIKQLASINGSCIYATEYAHGYVFSTTVESEERENKNMILNLLSMKRGKGILSDEVHLIHVSPELETRIIAKYKKDRLPFKLFQYGVIRFPSGLQQKDTLVIYPCAVKNFDGDTVFLDSNSYIQSER